MVQFTIALISGQRLFLDRPVWKTEPWRGEAAPPKTPQNELVDIMVNIPGYLQDAAAIKREADPGTQLVALVGHLRADLANLYEWRWRWEQRNPHGAYELDPVDLPTGKMVGSFRLCHNVLWFHSFTQATEILLYNAVLLCLLGALWQFEPPDESQVGIAPSTPLMLPGECSSLFEPAEEICRAFEYQLLNVNNGGESALFWLLPLGVAHKVLEGEPEYAKWITSMLDSSRVTRGYGTGNSEFAFGNYPFPKFGVARRKFGGQ